MMFLLEQKILLENCFVLVHYIQLIITIQVRYQLQVF